MPIQNVRGYFLDFTELSLHQIAIENLSADPNGSQKNSASFELVLKCYQKVISVTS